MELAVELLSECRRSPRLYWLAVGESSFIATLGQRLLWVDFPVETVSSKASQIVRYGRRLDQEYRHQGRKGSRERLDQSESRKGCSQYAKLSRIGVIDERPLSAILLTSPFSSQPVAFVLFLIIVFSPAGMVYTVECLRLRRRKYKQFKKFMKEYDVEKGREKLRDEIDTEALAKKIPDDRKRQQFIERELKRRLKKRRYEIRRIYGAGICRGWLPNPKEWWDSYRNWRRGGKGFSGNLGSNRQIRILKMMLERNHNEVLAELLKATTK